MDQASFQAFIIQTTNWLVQAVPNAIAAIFILLAGFFLARWLSRMAVRLLGSRPQLDQTLTPVIAALLHYFILIIAFVAALGQLGIQTASILAVLGAAGLAIGLALQGTLSNIAAGLMLLWLRPFRVGESIETSSVSGTVLEIGLFATSLRSGEGLYNFVPNSSLWNTPIRNLSRNGTRRMEVKFALPQGADVSAARTALLDIAARNEHVRKDPKPVVLVTGFGETTIELVLRAWATSSDHAQTASDLAETGRRKLDQVLPERAAA